MHRGGANTVATELAGAHEVLYESFEVLQTLNASLRVMHHLEHIQAFPSHEELLPNLHAEYLQHRVSLEALDAYVPAGWRHLGTCEHKQIARPHET